MSAIQHPSQVLPVGTKLTDVTAGNGAGDRVEHGEVDRYRAINEGVTPYPIRVADKVFVFDKRPPARLQLEAITLFADRDGDSQLSIDDMQTVLAMLRAMISAPEKLDELMDLVDLPELSELMGKAMEKVTVRPTTGSSDSQPSALPTTSATGSSAADSTQPTSTG